VFEIDIADGWRRLTGPARNIRPFRILKAAPAVRFPDFGLPADPE
jgi:hypothetical protein